MVNERYASGSVGETCSIADQIIQMEVRFSLVKADRNKILSS